MRAVGIVVEYNPMHNGHAYHVARSRDVTGADVVVAVMSGNFLQRGEPALANKWARAEMALRQGVDVVLELPAVYATQNAELFAWGAMACLEALGGIDAVCFGSESGAIDWMLELAERLAEEPEGFRARLREALAQGMSFPKAFGQAVNTWRAAQGLPPLPVDQPNNILGLHYCLALRRMNSAIRPVTIRREKAGYHDAAPTDKRIASATAIRRLWLEAGRLDAVRPYVPETTYAILRREEEAARAPMHWERLYPLLLHQFAVLEADEIAAIVDVDEGLEHRLLRAVRTAPSFEAFLRAAKTKRYTWTRLQRALVHLLLRLTKDRFRALDVRAGVPYLRVLGFTARGREFLRRRKKHLAVPLVTRASQLDHPLFAFDLRAARVYALGYPPEVAAAEWNREFRQPPVQV